MARGWKGCQKAVDCPIKDHDALVAFYDFPPEWGRSGRRSFSRFSSDWLRSGHTNLLLFSRVAVCRFSSGITKVLDKVVRESAGGALIVIKLGDVLRILARRTAAFCFRKPTVPASRLLTIRAILSLKLCFRRTA